MSNASERKLSGKRQCHAGRVAGKPCRTPGEPVTLLDPFEPNRLILPGKIHLCTIHRSELMERGVRAFVEKYPVPEKGKQSAAWENDEVLNQKAVREVPLSFIQPEFVESLINVRALNEPGPEYSWRDEYAHFKDSGFKLEQADLTDKQLTAVCLVFFGGVQRKRAARAMKISSQALGVHIKAALKKIEQTLCH